MYELRLLPVTPVNIHTIGDVSVRAGPGLFPQSSSSVAPSLARITSLWIRVRTGLSNNDR
jgi:hypothetical protein